MTNTDSGAPEYQYDWQNPNLKSFEVGRVVSNTFRALQRNVVPFLSLTFIGAGIPMILFSLWPLFLGLGEGINFYDANWFENIEWEGIVGIAVSVYILWMLFGVIIYGALIRMSVNALNERQVHLGDAFRTGLKYFFPILFIMLIYMIAMIVGLLLLIVPGILIALGWALVWNIKIIEDLPFTEVFSRSWSLSKGYKRWILLMMVIFGVLGGVIGLVFQIPVMFFGNSQTAIIEGGSTTFWIVNAIASGLAQMVSVALSYVGLTATYLEIRRVKEGVASDKIADIFS